MKKFIIPLILILLLTFTLSAYSVWVSPTGYIDDAYWSDETLAYDEDTGTKASGGKTGDGWTGTIQFTISSISCDSIRYWVTRESVQIDNMDVDAYYNSQWNHVYLGVPEVGSYITKNLGGTYAVTKVRFNFYNNEFGVFRNAYIHEVDFNQVVPPQVTNVQATDGVYTDKVVITWDAATGATGYDVWTGASWVDVGNILTYDHTTAPAPTITAGTASASDGTSSEYITLSIAGESANVGSSISYKVRAYNAAGDGAESAVNTGYRGVGALTYQWQRSAADSDADYSNIDGATTDPYNDTGAPENGDGRYYKCIENATGASQQTTNSDRGCRLTVGWSHKWNTQTISKWNTKEFTEWNGLE